VGYPKDMQKSLWKLYEETRLQASHFSFAICEEQIMKSLEVYPKTTLVLDALDECDRQSRRQLIDAIERFAANSNKPIKVFISSRPDRDIRNYFRLKPNVEIQANDNNEDIKRYINEQIVEHERWNDMTPALQKKIRSVLTSRSEEM
jgi:ankyrin repeat domain-containing protein 50